LQEAIEGITPIHYLPQSVASTASLLIATARSIDQLGKIPNSFIQPILSTRPIDTAAIEFSIKHVLKRIGMIR
jgi:hypothetical protein